VPPGHIASVVTHLEMTSRPKARPFPNAPLHLRRLKNPEPTAYRSLYKLVGAPWLWFSRLCYSDEELAALLTNPATQLSIIEDRRRDAAGMLELDFRQDGQCEITYLGLVPSLNGKGFGTWLMAHGLALAWAGQKNRPTVERVWLRTCTLDHPGAMAFYQKNGFTPVKQEIEIYPDPRLSGDLPMDSAPQIPVFRA